MILKTVKFILKQMFMKIKNSYVKYVKKGIIYQLI